MDVRLAASSVGMSNGTKPVSPAPCDGRATVVYESLSSATEEVARSVAAGLATAGWAVTVHDTASAWSRGLPACDLLVVGCPTHSFCVAHPGAGARPARRSAWPAAAPIGLPQLLWRLCRRHRPDGGHFATFDTRVGRLGNGRAAGAARAAHVLARHGLHPVTYPTGFTVDDHRGPVARRELDRARGWGAMVARSAADLSGGVGGRARLSGAAGRPGCAAALR